MPGGACQNEACRRTHRKCACSFPTTPCCLGTPVLSDTPLFELAVVGMCANAAIEKQKRLRAEVHAGIDAARRGNGDVHHAAAPDNVPPQHVLSNRLAHFKAAIEQSNTDEWRDKAVRANLFWQAFQAGKEAPNPGDPDYDDWQAMEEVIKKANEDHAPLECGICMSELTADEDLFLGKRCYHLYHKSCILMNARVQSRAMGDLTIWHEGEDGQKIWNEHRAGEFPSVGTLPCPECRNPEFCDKTHYTMLETVLPEVLAGNVSAMDAVSEPDQLLDQARRDKYVWLAEVPGHQELTMVVEAKVPFDPANRKGPSGFIGPSSDFSTFSLKNRLRDCVPPFKFDYDGSITGAKCYYREKQEDEAGDMPIFDPIPDGAEIALTCPRPNKQTREVGVASYKLNLPVTMHPKYIGRQLGIDDGPAAEPEHEPEHELEHEPEPEPVVAEGAAAAARPSEPKRKRVINDDDSDPDFKDSDEDEEPLSKRLHKND